MEAQSSVVINLIDLLAFPLDNLFYCYEEGNLEANVYNGKKIDTREDTTQPNTYMKEIISPHTATEGR